MEKQELNIHLKDNSFKFKLSNCISLMFWLIGGFILLIGLGWNWNKLNLIYNEDIKISYPKTSYYRIYNAKILTYNNTQNLSNPNPTYFESTIIKDGYFIRLGNNKELALNYPEAEPINLKGYTMMPGLFDAHAHLLARGRQILQVDLTGLSNLNEIHLKIEQFIKNKSDNKIDFSKDWILGYGWDQNIFNDGKFPTYKDLLFNNDKLDNIPIVLKRIDFHGVWVNFKTLQLIKEQYPNLDNLNFEIEGGSILRFKESNLPTGILLDNAQHLLDNILPKDTDESDLKALEAITKEMHQFGLIGAHDAGINVREQQVFKKALLNNQLKIRVHSMLRCMDTIDTCTKEQFRELKLPKLNFNSQHLLNLNSIKVVLDGALGSFGASMLEPYSDKNSTGWLTFDLTLLNEKIKLWDELGFQVNIHAIGDKANRLALDAFESLLDFTQNESLVSKRHRIEHAQILTKSDLPRFNKLGIIPSMQPTHATSDMAYAFKRLGNKRLKYAYAWKDLLNTGIEHLPLSSDFPVESVDPRLGFYAALTRLDKNGNSPHGNEGWYKEQKLTFFETLRGFTSDAAYAAFQENELGSIEAGKRADFIIVSKPWCEIEPKELLSPSSRVLATFLNGEKVFEYLN